jgi:hypothetical protein
MDPNVFRSTSHPVYHVETDLVSPCYLATDASRSLRHGDHFSESLPGTIQVLNLDKPIFLIAATPINTILATSTAWSESMTSSIIGIGVPN